MSASPLVQQISAAAGPQDGDYLTFSNAWASITVRRDGDRAAHIWVAEGDCSQLGFPHLQDAVHFALGTLAEFQKGRAV